MIISHRVQLSPLRVARDRHSPPCKRCRWWQGGSSSRSCGLWTQQIFQLQELLLCAPNPPFLVPTLRVATEVKGREGHPSYGQLLWCWKQQQQFPNKKWIKRTVKKETSKHLQTYWDVESERAVLAGHLWACAGGLFSQRCRVQGTPASQSSCINLPIKPDMSSVYCQHLHVNSHRDID